MDLLPASRPPAPDVELRVWTLDDFAQLAQLRAALHGALAEGAGDAAVVGELIEKVAVVATELATNALRHGLPPTTVRLSRADDRFLLDVADHDLAAVPELDEERPFGQGGLGLLFAHRFSLETGWYTTAATKHVWATFPR